MSIRFEYLKLDNGITLHTALSGQGKPILFVHGFPEFWYEWKDQLEEFGADHSCIAPDLRGFNLSDKPPGVEDYRVRKVIEDLRLLLKRLGHGPAVVVAHDWGGAAAWSLAALHPECVERLVIINSPHPVVFARELRDNPAQRWASEYMNLFRAEKAERVLLENNCSRMLRMSVEQWGANGGDASPAVRDAYYASWNVPGALTGALNYYRASRLYPRKTGETPIEVDETFPVLRMPVLVIWGERDEFLLTGNLRGLNAYASDLKIVRIPDASHWVVHERPRQVNTLIWEFITRANP
jgi:pimeloyl-ACP methyl ester carboxylesterase